MNTVSLPSTFDLDATLAVDVFDYNSVKEMGKQQVVLDRNTFSFLCEGEKEVYFDHSSFSIDQASFLLMKSGHCIMTERLSDTRKNYRSILLFFSNDLVWQFIRKYDLHVSTPVEPTSVHRFDYDSFSKGFVSSLKDLVQLPKSIQQKLLSIKLEEIFLYLIELKGSDFLLSLVQDSDNTTQNFIRTVESNQLNKLTLQELAFLNNQSVSSFKRTFERHYHASPIKWFQNRRLEHAQHLIKDEGKRPSDIYDEVGYENLSSFVQAYKAKYGVTPKQHQKHLDF